MAPHTRILTLVLLAAAFAAHATAQTRTVGLFVNDTARAYRGYTLFAPKQNTMTYLINNEGRIVHQWTASTYAPGQSVYLLENGHLLRSCMTRGRLSAGGGEGGRVEEYDWDDKLVWQLDFSTDTYMQHHDIRPLPNGNLLMLVIEKKTMAEAIAAGFDPASFQPEVAQKGLFLPDYVVEIEPTRPAGGTVVWEWHVWDHLIQDFDATKQNYGVPRAHPELIDAAGDGRKLPVFWNHMNSIDYHAGFDQIALSVRGNSEVWIIDHGTTTAEAKGHTGGRRGKGGDLLYRWGNPATYGAGTSRDQKYFEQHDVEWVRAGYPGEGRMTCFNNGLGRGNYSTVDEFSPAVDAAGNYTTPAAGVAYGPATYSWSYQGNAANPLYSENISGAHRLPNGNTLLCSGTVGLFLEVTTAGDIVWKYICPVEKSGILTQGDTLPNDPARPGEKLNSVFRITRYPPDYAAFTGRDLTPGDFVEKYRTDVSVIPEDAAAAVLGANYPNPFSTETVIPFSLTRAAAVTLSVHDLLGRRVALLHDGWSGAGQHQVRFDASKRAASSGLYLVELRCGSHVQRRLLVLETSGR